MHKNRLCRMFAALFLILPALFPGKLAALEQKSEVTVRFSEHEKFSRVVFETSTEPMISGATVTAEKNMVKVQFPSGFFLKHQGKPNFKILQQGNTVTIDRGQPVQIKILKLSGPPRLSVDIFSEVTKTEDKQTAGGESAAAALPAAIRIIIDPGHGGYDSGILTEDSREKDIMLSLARYIENAITRKGRTVHLTRKVDQFLSLTDRAVFANQKNPEIFITLHLSSGAGFAVTASPADQGAADNPLQEQYGMSYRQKKFRDKSRLLSESLTKTLGDEFKSDKIEIAGRNMNLPLLNSISAAAVMIETPGSLIYDHAAKIRLADAIIRGITVYAGK